MAVHVVLALLVSGPLSGIALAQGPIRDVNDGNALRRECAAVLDAASCDLHVGTGDPVEHGSDMGQCLGLVAGVWHTHMMMVDEFGSRSAFCPPGSLAAEDMTRIVTGYLERHPAELDSWDTVLVLRAFSLRPPCS